jgi:hypothetical protein
MSQTEDNYLTVDEPIFKVEIDDPDQESHPEFDPKFESFQSYQPSGYMPPISRFESYQLVNIPLISEFRITRNSTTRSYSRSYMRYGGCNHGQIFIQVQQDIANRADHDYT